MDRRDFLKNTAAVSSILSYFSWKQSSEIITNSDAVEELADNTEINEPYGIIRYPLEVNFRWISDTEMFNLPERWQMPSEYIENDFRGDCEDHALFATALLNQKNYDSRTVFGRVNAEAETKSYSGFHALCQVKINNRTLFNDITSPRELLEEKDWERLLGKKTTWQPYAQLRPREEVESYDPDW